MNSTNQYFKIDVQYPPVGQMVLSGDTGKRIYRIVTAALVTIFAAMISFAGSTLAQSVQGDFTVPYKSITPQVESTIENTVIIALRQLSQARADIHRKTLANARHDLAEAARLMESIRDDLSTAAAKNLIRIARNHLEYEPAQHVLHDLSPIYSSLDRISVYLPTDKATLHIDRAKGYLERNAKGEADRELALADKSLIVVEVEQPLLGSQRYVTKAQGYLAAGNARKADEALQVAEKRAMALYSGVNSPLVQAKRHIWLAFRSYSLARHAEAKTHLEQARNYLNKEAAGGNAKGKEEAGKLSQEVADLEKKLAGDGMVAESALKAAWEKSEALVERSTAYLDAGISDEETTLKGENNLIEARLHVAYAETYQVTTTEPDRATKELDTAYSYLQKAAESRLAGPADRKEIREIGSILLAFRVSPEKSDADVQERYDTVKEKLSDLIQKI